MGAGLNATGAESPNVVVYRDDSVYDESGDKCIYAQWYEEESRNCWKIPIGEGEIVRDIFNLEAEGRQCSYYDDDVKLVGKSVNFGRFAPKNASVKMHGITITNGWRHMIQHR